MYHKKVSAVVEVTDHHEKILPHSSSRLADGPSNGHRLALLPLQKASIHPVLARSEARVCPPPGTINQQPDHR